MATSGAWRERSPSLPEPLPLLDGAAAQPNRPDFSSLPELSTTSPPRNALGPLREPLFRTLWIAAVVSYTGSWMQNVGAAWLMTSLTMSPLMVGLVQAAGSIAVFMVVLPAGALADMVDRRKLLLFTQSWMVLAAAVLGALTLAGKITPALLLVLTFLMGFGAVLNDPAWQAITPEVVSRRNFAAGSRLEFCRLQRRPRYRTGIRRIDHRRGGIGPCVPAERGFVLRRHLFPLPLEARTGQGLRQHAAHD